MFACLRESRGFEAPPPPDASLEAFGTHLGGDVVVTTREQVELHCHNFTKDGKTEHVLGLVLTLLHVAARGPSEEFFYWLFFYLCFFSEVNRDQLSLDDGALTDMYMCVCACVCVCIHMCVCIYVTHMYTHTHIHTHRGTHTLLPCIQRMEERTCKIAFFILKWLSRRSHIMTSPCKERFSHAGAGGYPRTRLDCTVTNHSFVEIVLSYQDYS